MRNILIIKLMFIGCIQMSCSDEFLDLAPISQSNVRDSYNTAEDINLAVSAAYASLHLTGSYGHHLATIPELRSDNTIMSWMNGDAGRENIIEFQVQTNNTYIDQIWRDNYLGILRCNVVLDRIEPIEMEEDLKKRYIGEVKFLRALTYFNMVRLFGELPLVLKETRSVEEGYEFGRESVSVVYEQIIEDLNEAGHNLPDSYSNSEIGRATKGAAKALLGKVYLTLKNYQSAKEILEEVIDSNIYELLPNYGDLWIVNNKNSIESIFEVQYKKGGLGTGSRYANISPPKFSSPYTVEVGSAAGHMTPTQEMADAYEEGDLRKNLSIASGWVDGSGEFFPEKWVIKYVDIPFLPNDSDNNWPVLRYADVLLMYAEILNEISFEPNGKAFDFLNQIRLRAGLEPKTSNNPVPSHRISNQEEFRLALEKERRIELAFEGHRLFDLVRTDRFVEVMSHFYEVNNHQQIFPIPQSQIDINPSKISQNPGYIQ